MSEDIKALLTELNEQTRSMGANIKELISYKDEDGKWKTTADKRFADIEGAIKTRGIHLPGLEDDKIIRDFNLPGVMMDVATGRRDKKLAKEWDLLDECKRTMSTDVDTKGGYVVPPVVTTNIIEKQRPRSVALSLGATEMKDIGGTPLHIPKETGVPTIAETAEGGTISFSDAAFGEVQFTPKELSGGVVSTRRLGMLSNPAVRPLFERRLASELALRMDYLILKGTGSSNQPLGILNHAGIGSVSLGTDGGPITWAKLIDLEGELEDDNALVGKIGIAFHGKVRRHCAKIVDGDGRPLFNREPGGNGSLPIKTLMGYPYLVSNQLPTNLTKAAGTNLAEFLLGNWEDCAIGYWGGLLLERTMEATVGGVSTFETHKEAVKVVQLFDSHLLRDESFAAFTDVNYS